MTEQLEFTTPEILIARNPYGLFSPFDPELSIFRAIVDIEAIPVESIEPSAALKDEFREIRRVEIPSNDGKTEMISHALSWEGRDLASINFMNYRESPESPLMVFNVQTMNSKRETLQFEPYSEAFIHTNPKDPDPLVRIADKDSEISLFGIVDNPTSWEKIVSFSHEGGHLTRLKALPKETVVHYQSCLRNFEAFIVVDGGSTDPKLIELASQFDRFQMSSILNYEHSSNVFAIKEIKRLSESINIPDSLHLQLLKRLVRNYRTYCAWGPVVMNK